MQSARASVKACLCAASACLLAVLCAFGWFGPNLLFFVAEFKRTSLYSLSLCLFLIVGCTSYLLADKRGQAARAFACLFSVVVATTQVYFLSRVFFEDFGNCKKYTEMFNGGLRAFDGKSYTVELCGLGPDQEEWDKVRIKILDGDNRPVAVRHFKFSWAETNIRSLEYTSNGIRYFDSSDDDDFEKHIAMLPSIWERLAARLPRSPFFD